jgi:hypothetical protein
MKRAIAAALAFLLSGACLAALPLVRAAEEETAQPGLEAPGQERPPLIQMAILLDTSGSMDGLIDQAKTQLWSIVNEFATARRQGRPPELQVALYEYGKSSIAAEEGYLRMIVPLSTDLDKISEELFALRTNGGDEYCGQVIRAATRALQWSDNPRDLKLIYIAGNEPFTQGKVDYKVSCKEAIGRGIVVNTIFCGDREAGLRTDWKAGADLADGSYMNIDQNRKVVHIDAPQDAEIAELGRRLNTTYLAFGVEGEAASERQAAMDVAAASVATGVAVQRQVAKASTLYEAGDWDVVDAVRKNPKALEEMKDEDLPKEMRGMTLEQKKEFVAKKEAERAQIQKRIKELSAARDKFIAAERAKLAEKGEDTLEAVVLKSARAAAAKRGFVFEQPAAAE